MDNATKAKKREELKSLIEEWNANRLDLFEITVPDEKLEYHGVMRFFFQDEGAKLATKCVRVSSTANTSEVIETLVEKFRPDMKMLSSPTYYLYEVDSKGIERRMEPNERPLEVQLNWTRDEREGKFVLRNAAHKALPIKTEKDETSFRRKSSKRDKKKTDKKGRDEDSGNEEEEPSGVFIRTKSNSEAVMKRRREIKVQKKLEEIQREGDQGGLLKIHGDSLNVDVPYKSLLLSVTDTAAFVVKEMLDKYGLTRADPTDYCLVQIFNAHAGEIGGGLRPQEHILEDNDCPLAILNYQVNRGNISFHVRRKDGKRMSKDDKVTPFLLELNLDGSELQKAKKHMLHINMTEVGSIAQPSSGQHLRLIGPTIMLHHAVIANIEGVVTVTPTSGEAECYVEGQRIYETTVLQHGKVVRFGHHHAFRFIDPKVEATRKVLSSNGVAAGPPAVENGPPGYSPRLDDVLPAGLEFRDEGEDNFLHAVITDVTEGMCQFKLAPCYSLYLATRYRVDRVRPGCPPEEHFRRLADFTTKVSYMIRDCVSRYQGSPQELAFWIANMSELLHFYKMDCDLLKHTAHAQDVLADTVHDAFKDLVFIMQGDLLQSMPAFLADSENDQEAERIAMEQGTPSIGEVLHVLSSAMSLLRRCRVNAALTIQLFSQLFHFINMWLFNKLVTEQGYISRKWGVRLKRRLSRVEAWAEKQGLELAADCHLCRITQAAHLLQAPKFSPDDIASISSACFKLNSVQLRVLLEEYRRDLAEPKIPQDLIESVVSVARNTADDLTRSEGREVRLEEEADLQLPFLLPEDGYSCDIIKGIPQGLGEFLDPVMADGLCRLTPLPSQSASWTVFMPEHEDNKLDIMDDLMSPEAQPVLPREPEIIVIHLNKVNGSMGLSIVAAKGESQPEKGIYIKSVVPGGAAALDGQLQAGDQLLEVDGKSLVGLSQERAAELMKETGQVVKLRVTKQGAIYHGLATLLQQPTPPMSRAAAPGQPLDQPYNLAQSKSTPALNNMYNKQQFAGPSPPEDLRSKSQANLKGPLDADKGRWPSPQIPDNRALSQPNLGMNDSYGDHSPNYQNVPGDVQLRQQAAGQQRPVSQYRESTGPPTPLSQRPRSEFVDPSWYPPPPQNDYPPRQNIYQNQQKGGAIPSKEEDNLPLPPPPSNDYVNYNVDATRFGADPRNRPEPAQVAKPSEQPPARPGLDQRYERQEVKAQEPPWARSGPVAVQRAPVAQPGYPRPTGPSVSVQPASVQMRPSLPTDQQSNIRNPPSPGFGPRSPTGMSQPPRGSMTVTYRGVTPQFEPFKGGLPSDSPRVPLANEAYRGAPANDQYRPGEPAIRGPQPGDALRGQPVDPTRGLQPGENYRGQPGEPLRSGWDTSRGSQPSEPLRGLQPGDGFRNQPGEPFRGQQSGDLARIQQGEPGRGPQIGDVFRNQTGELVRGPALGEALRGQPGEPFRGQQPGDSMRGQPGEPFRGPQPGDAFRNQPGEPFRGAQPGDTIRGQSGDQFRSPLPGEPIRAQPVEPFRGPQPGDTIRPGEPFRVPQQGEPFRGPQPGDAFRGQQGPRPFRPQVPQGAGQQTMNAAYNQQTPQYNQPLGQSGPQYNQVPAMGSTQYNQPPPLGGPQLNQQTTVGGLQYNQPPMQGFMGPRPTAPIRPPMNQQAIQQQLSYVSANPWQKENDSRRLMDDRRMQRDDAIRDLESKPYRTTEEEDRLARLRLDSEFERRAEQERREDENRDSDSDEVAKQRPDTQRTGLPNNQQRPFDPRRPANTQPESQITDIPNAVKREVLQSKTVTFKPAYKDDTLRPGDFAKPIVKPGIPDSADTRGNPNFGARGFPQPRDQQELLNQQKEQTGPYSLSTPEKEALRMRLEEELREKQRRESEEQRRALQQQEDEEMRRRREHDVFQRRESDRIQVQQMQDARDEQQRFMREQDKGRPSQPRDYPGMTTNFQTTPSYHNRPGVGHYNDPDNRGGPLSAPDRKSVSFQPSAAPFRASVAPTQNYQNMPSNGVNGRTPNSQSGVELITGATPGVIGAQEVYRDPRQRVEVQMRGQKSRPDSTDRMSFREKMKMFAAEAGENTPIERPKSSRTQRVLEDALTYGNGEL